MNDPANLVVACWFHHRMLHAELIGLTGQAPGDLRWRRPKLMETAVERHDHFAGSAESVDDFDLEPETEAFDAAEVPNVWQSGSGPEERAPAGL